MNSYKFRLPNYFAQSVRKEIGQLYASVAIADLALAIVTLFEPIFLYSIVGLSIPQILIFNGIAYAVYIVLIPFGAKIATLYGYAHGILFSIPFQILFWIFLYAGQDNISLLFIAPVLYGIEKSLYWPSFHASVARFAQDEQRGREFGVLYFIVNAVSIIGPFIGGFLSEKFGVRITFVFASAIYVCSFIPLFMKAEVFVPKVYQYRDTWKLYKEFPRKFLGYIGFGEEMLLLNIWPIYVYVIVVGYEKIGLLVTVATLIGTVLGLYVGKITDQYSKRVLIKIGAFFYFLFWVFRTIALSPISVFAAETFSRTSKDLVFIPLSTLTYERAEATHIMPYIVFFEQSLAVGKLIAAILGAGIFTLVTVILGFSLSVGFMVLFVIAGLFSLFYMFI